VGQVHTVLLGLVRGKGVPIGAVVGMVTSPVLEDILLHAGGETGRAGIVAGGVSVTLFLYHGDATHPLLL
jgi:hypothetical protein